MSSSGPDASLCPSALDVNTLCFSGGGTSGIAFAGVLAAFAQLPLLDYRRKDRQVVNYYGCSVGAFFALVAYLRCDMAVDSLHFDLEEYMRYFDRGNSWPQAADVGGFSFKGRGDEVVAFLDRFIEDHTGIRDATLHDLHLWQHERGSLVLYATSLESGGRRLSYRTAPHIKASVAVFVSALIPWLFEPREVLMLCPHARPWIRPEHLLDGAVGGNNYPVHDLRDGERAVGVRFRSNQQKYDVCKEGKIGAYAMLRRMVSLGVGSASYQKQRHHPSRRSPVPGRAPKGVLLGDTEIVTGGHDPLDCHPSFDKKRHLFQQGVEAALRLILEQEMIVPTEETLE